MKNIEYDLNLLNKYIDPFSDNPLLHFVMKIIIDFHKWAFLGN